MEWSLWLVGLLVGCVSERVSGSVGGCVCIAVRVRTYGYRVNERDLCPFLRLTVVVDRVLV